ncbi:hypothetical protein JY651_50915 [Pyxidicoccus parkwayensis]|uniref:Lipoprotein n=1 Tax=Pyxidicoccus parkwayensis TaxID=2813578 RepID=A0ABX7NWY1_9BACT|nr:hypothetical protein [Pyxidicoccus parkwaysis]QSQ23300.1 hypothetical protein JY651_50915 [Pyxidicoccus parkwaysis]
MMRRNRGSQWLGALALAAGAMTVGCSSDKTTDEATSEVSQAVEAASDSSDAVEVSSLLRGLDKLRPNSVEGFHCDASPDITYVDVCGQSLPATVHLEWTDCAAPARPGGGRGGGGHGGGGDGGGGAPPPGGPVRAHSVESASADGGGAPGGHGGPSTGTVDITTTYTAPENCEGAVTQEQSVAFNISRTNSSGEVSTSQGTTSSTAELTLGAPPRTKATQADVTRTKTDASGTVVSSVHLTGSLSVAFSDDTPPVRTIDGSYSEEFLDGTQGTVTLAGITRPPRDVCPWPTSGTLTRATADGETHVLAFGPECGDATLDGTAVDLPERGERGGGRH